MKILILAQDYPSASKRYAMSYVHTRSLGYTKSGHNVAVLSFSARQSYEYEGVSVFTESEIDLNKFDLIASHAPNLKNHVRLLSSCRGKKIVFFFHGHEVLLTSQYPKPYLWKKKKWGGFHVAVYDYLKLLALKFWLPYFSKRNKVGLVFVSQWMQDRFESNLRIKAEKIGLSSVIPNSVHDAFIERNYAQNAERVADFVTIRPLDESKYCVDLVVKLAKENPSNSFHLYGRGDYFKHNQKPENLTVFGDFISQSDIPSLLDKYRFALMPTRYDAQGVMMCEMATYGIPVITSDFSVCKEMLCGYENVAYLPLDAFSFKSVKPHCVSSHEKKLKFLSKTLIQKEVEFFNEL